MPPSEGACSALRNAGAWKRKNQPRALPGRSFCAAPPLLNYTPFNPLCQEMS
jgi:hypothetical protein